jgi:hypothetical protein
MGSHEFEMFTIALPQRLAPNSHCVFLGCIKAVLIRGSRRLFIKNGSSVIEFSQLGCKCELDGLSV